MNTTYTDTSDKSLKKKPQSKKKKGYSDYDGGYRRTETKTEGQTIEQEYKVKNLKLQANLDYLRRTNKGTWRKYTQYKKKSQKDQNYKKKREKD